MKGVNRPARLYALKDRLKELAPNDTAFVSEMMDLLIPRLPPNQPGFHTFGQVKVDSISPGEKIWRYMPLEQLFALLSTKKLHFSPLSTMDDKTEGQLPERVREEMKREVPYYILEGRGSMDADAFVNTMEKQRNTDACISSWYTGDSEDLQMWKEYAPKNGVAIQSTVRRLATSLQASNMPVAIAPVAYFAHKDEKKYVNQARYGSLYIKHDQFGHEKELRALTNGHGTIIPVDVETLIERLVLSPELKGWAIPYITEAIQDFGFTGCIKRSTLHLPTLCWCGAI